MVFRDSRGCPNKMFSSRMQICVGCTAELSEGRKSKHPLIRPARVWITLFGSGCNAPLLLINFVCNSKLPPPVLTPTEARRNEWIFCEFFCNVITWVFQGEKRHTCPRDFTVFLRVLPLAKNVVFLKERLMNKLSTESL